MGYVLGRQLSVLINVFAPGAFTSGAAITPVDSLSHRLRWYPIFLIQRFYLANLSILSASPGLPFPLPVAPLHRQVSEAPWNMRRARYMVSTARSGVLERGSSSASQPSRPLLPSSRTASKLTNDPQSFLFFFVVIDARSRYRTGSIRGSRSRPNEIRSRDRRRWAYHERLQLPGRKKTHFRVGEEAVRILVCRPLGSALGRTPTWPVHGVYGG